MQTKQSFEELCKEIESAVGTEKWNNHREGIIEDFKSFLEKRFPAGLDEYRKMQSDSNSLDQFLEEYFKKSEEDYSVKNIAELILEHYGMPPISAMSSGSLEQTIGQLMDSDAYSKNVYYRRIGLQYARCVGLDIVRKITFSKEVSDKVAKQIGKAEMKNDDSPEWRRYFREKAELEARQARLEAEKEQMEEDSRYSYCDSRCTFNHFHSMFEIMFLKVDALFNRFFTNFDETAYYADKEELQSLYLAYDLGDRYEELFEILNSEDFKWKYYQPRDRTVDNLACAENND